MKTTTDGKNHDGEESNNKETNDPPKNTSNTRTHIITMMMIPMMMMKRLWCLACLLTTANSLVRNVNHHAFRPRARQSYLLFYMTMERPSSPKGM
jgi:hypothetical protein